MREISCNAIISSIKEMCIQATHYLSDDMKSALYKGVEKEESPLGRQILEQLCENLTIAGEDMIPICPDTMVFTAVKRLFIQRRELNISMRIRIDQPLSPKAAYAMLCFHC